MKARRPHAPGGRSPQPEVLLWQPTGNFPVARRNGRQETSVRQPAWISVSSSQALSASSESNCVTRSLHEYLRSDTLRDEAVPRRANRAPLLFERTAIVLAGKVERHPIRSRPTGQADEHASRHAWRPASPCPARFAPFARRGDPLSQGVALDPEQSGMTPTIGLTASPSIRSMASHASRRIVEHASSRRTIILARMKSFIIVVTRYHPNNARGLLRAELASVASRSSLCPE